MSRSPTPLHFNGNSARQASLLRITRSDLELLTQDLNAGPRRLGYSLRKTFCFAKDTLAMTLDRRGFLSACSRAGITSALLPGILYTLAAQAQEASPAAGEHNPLAKITPEMLDQACLLAAVGPFTA